MKLRNYQADSVAACYDHLRTRDGNPVIVLPTGAGKTPVLATICKDAVGQWGGRVLVLAHNKELIEQDADKLEKVAPEIEYGIYCAGLKRRDESQPVIIASIQSIYSSGCEFAPFDLVIVDEAHMIPSSVDTMYGTLLTDLKVVNPNCRIIGLTATPYRLDDGSICGPDRFLNHICYEAGVKDLINQGYLCPLVNKGTDAEASVNLDSVKKRGGEFIPADLSETMNTDELVEQSCNELMVKTQERHSILVFCVLVAHAQHVAEVLREMTGERVEVVHGETPADERKRHLGDFKSGDLRWLVNVNVLTTGFDAPNIDCVALLRPTLSPSLYCQMVGRGLRIDESKKNCLVLDFGGNIERHGPLDQIQVGDGKNGSGTAPAKTCRKCKTVMHAARTSCPDCGEPMPVEEREPSHNTRADTKNNIIGEPAEPEVHEITRIAYSEHAKRGADESHPKTLRVDYFAGMLHVASEWVCVEHTGGFAREKALAWWKERCRLPMPPTADEAARTGEACWLSECTQIGVIEEGKYKRVVAHVLGERPEDGGDIENPSLESVWEGDIPF